MHNPSCGSDLEDVFYFTRDPVTLAEIARIAVSLGFTPWHAPPEAPSAVLRLGYGSERNREVLSRDGSSRVCTVEKQDYVEWSEWHDWDSLEPADRRRIEEYQPESSFCVSLHADALPQVRELLKAVLQRFGGWEGADEEWDRTYEADTVAHLVLAGIEIPE